MVQAMELAMSNGSSPLSARNLIETEFYQWWDKHTCVAGQTHTKVEQTYAK
jgi:hypothetical protein